uniref:DUF1758 domain-containing protein n=1 Tax=Syphacia muris TaxID=451379 RepID=A0A0N5ACW3_9BILA
MAAVNTGYNVRKSVTATKACIFCRGNHFNDTCKTYPDLGSRRTIVKQKKLCERCLKQAHPAGKCRAALRPCFFCDDSNHLGSMCPKQFKSKEKSVENVAHLALETSDEERDDGRIQEIMEMQIPNREQPLSVSAKTKLYNPVDQDVFAEVTVFADCGSSRSYIDELLARKLRLRLGEKVRGGVIRFGSGISEEFNYGPRIVTVGTKRGKVTILVRALEGLSENLPRIIASLKGEDDLRARWHSSRPGLIVGVDNLSHFNLHMIQVAEDQCKIISSLGSVTFICVTSLLLCSKCYLMTVTNEDGL